MCVCFLGRCLGRSRIQPINMLPFLRYAAQNSSPRDQLIKYIKTSDGLLNNLIIRDLTLAYSKYITHASEFKLMMAGIPLNNYLPQ